MAPVTRGWVKSSTLTSVLCLFLVFQWMNLMKYSCQRKAWLCLIMSVEKEFRYLSPCSRYLMISEASAAVLAREKILLHVSPESRGVPLRALLTHEIERETCVTCGRAAMQAADEGSLSTLHWTTAAVHLELGWHCLLCPHGPAWAGLWLTGHGRVKGRLIEHADELEMSSKYCCYSCRSYRVTLHRAHNMNTFFWRVWKTPKHFCLNPFIYQKLY